MDKMKRLNLIYGSILKFVYQNNIKKLFKFTKIPPKFFAGKLQNIWPIHVIALVFTSTILLSIQTSYNVSNLFGKKNLETKCLSSIMDVLISNCYKPTLICN